MKAGHKEYCASSFINTIYVPSGSSKGFVIISTLPVRQWLVTSDFLEFGGQDRADLSQWSRPHQTVMSSADTVDLDIAVYVRNPRIRQQYSFRHIRGCGEQQHVPMEHVGCKPDRKIDII